MNDALFFLFGRSTVKVMSDSSQVSVTDVGGNNVATKDVANGSVTFLLVPGTYTFTSGTITKSVNVGYKKSMTINMMTSDVIAGDTTVVENISDVLHIVSFDAENGILVTKSHDYED